MGVKYLKKGFKYTLILITILLVAAFIPCHAQEKASTVKWTQKSNNLYETTTFYFTVLTRIEDQKYLYLLDKLIGRLDQTVKQTSDFVGSKFKGSFGLFLDLDPDAGTFKWEQYRNYYKTSQLTGYINLGSAETIAQFEAFEPADYVCPFAAQLVLSVSSRAIVPFWMEQGLGRWIYLTAVVEKNAIWADYREANAISFQIKNKTLYEYNPMAAPQNWTSSSLNVTQATSIFYYLEHKYGVDAVSTFCKTWLAEPKTELAFWYAFGSSQKELESNWRLFVLFEGVSQYLWVDTGSAYKTVLSGAELNIKKTGTLWYDQTLDAQVQKIVAANDLIESCLQTFKKTPVLKFEFYKKATKNSVKKSSSGFDIKATSEGVEDIAADFLKVATDQAIATLKFKSLPKSAVEGFGRFIAVQSGNSSAERNADFFEQDAASAAYDQEDVFNALSFLLETYGSAKIVPLLSELNKGTSLRAAVIATTGDSEEQVNTTLDFVRYLPSSKTLQWSKIPGGFRTELGDLRFDVENQAIKTPMKSDLEKTLTAAAKIAQKTSELIGWKPDAATGKVTVRFGAGEPSASDSIFIPISTDNFEYAAENLDLHIVNCWLTMAAGGSKAPSWLVYGIRGILDEWNPDAVGNNIKSLATQLEDWTAPFGVKMPSSEQQDLWYTVTQYLFLETEHPEKLRHLLATAGEYGFEEGMEKTYGFGTSGLFAMWLCYMQVKSQSRYDWLTIKLDGSGVIYEATINGQKMQLLMKMDTLKYQPGYDAILDQIAQAPGKFAELIGIQEVPQLTLKLDFSGQARNFFQRNGTGITVDAESSHDWSFSGAAAFESACCLAELHWQSFDAGSVALPIWLRDGLAAYFMNIFSHEWEFSYHAGKNALTQKSRLIDIISSYHEDEVFRENLQLLASLFAFLEEKQSGCLKAFFAKMAEGASFERAIHEITGQELAAVESEWRSKLKE